MKLLELRQAASLNLLDTYLQLGSAAGDSEVSRQGGFTSCISPIAHPICNFAIQLDLNPSVTHRLAQVAREQGAFCVYQTPLDKPEHAPELLDRAGFEKAYGLTILIAEGREHRENIDLQPVIDFNERFGVAMFMSEQFFPRQNEAFRRLVAQASAAATGLDLYQVWSGRQRLASLMLSGGDVLGLYNLCVHPGFRGLGWGISTVQSVLSLAAQTGRRVSLQCEDRLVGWYEHLGFEAVGSVDVYDLVERRKRDIIG